MEEIKIRYPLTNNKYRTVMLPYSISCTFKVENCISPNETKATTSDISTLQLSREDLNITTRRKMEKKNLCLSPETVLLVITY